MDSLISMIHESQFDPMISLSVLTYRKLTYRSPSISYEFQSIYLVRIDLSARYDIQEVYLDRVFSTSVINTIVTVT